MKNYNLKLKIFAFCIVILIFDFCILHFAPKAQAQSVIRLVAIPPRLDVEVNPGDVIQKVIKVRNEGDSEIAIQTNIYDFIVSDDKGTPIAVAGETSGRWAASNWLTVSPNKFVLGAGEGKDLDLIILTPDDALAGGHYAVIFYEPIIEAMINNGSGAATTPQVGTLAYITVSGDITEEAFVRRMDIPKFSEYGPIKITTEIENMSDIHITPQGTIKIYNPLGKLASTLKLEEQNIFPTRSRMYENTFNRKWLFGKYKAALEAGYGAQGNSLTAFAYFWIIPYKVVAVAVLTIILIVLLIIYFRRKKKAVVQEEELGTEGN